MLNKEQPKAPLYLSLMPGAKGGAEIFSKGTYIFLFEKTNGLFFVLLHISGAESALPFC